ncbi:MAG: Hsp70 family protein, partial [Acidobacteria bacterium]|nr:Hsp70 family protein [Acidobacteriota bacterium]
MPNYCPSCQFWIVLPSDKYCSWCLKKFINIRLALEPDCLPAGEQSSARLWIHNLSLSSPTAIRAATSNAPWLQPDLSEPAPPFELAPGEERAVAWIADTRGLGATEAVVLVESSAGDEPATLQIFAPPEIAIEPDGGTLEYMLAGTGSQAELPVVVRLANNSRVKLEEILLEAEGVCELRGQGALPLELSSLGEREASFQLVVNEGAAKEGATGRRRAVPCSILCRFTDPFGDEFTREAAFLLNCWTPPRMTVWEFESPRKTIHSGAPERLRLQIQNSDDQGMADRSCAALVIRDIRVTNLEGEPAAWMVAEATLGEPMRLEAGKLGEFSFAVYPEGAGVEGQPEAGLGEHIVVFHFETNLPRDRAYASREFHITIRKLPVFPGVLAIDFGTSNSCCAYLNWQTNSYTVARIDPHSDTGSSPTIVQFMDLLGDEPVTRYGAKVVSLLAYSNPESVVQSVKRKLGQSDENGLLTVSFESKPNRQQRFLPRKVVTLYLTHLREALEEQARSRFTEIVVTHPSRFKLKQVEDLKQAVRDAFGDVKLTAYQEPIASGLAYIMTDEGRARGDYTIGVFDCGGGTTDLTIIRVQNIVEHGVPELRATVLASSGKWFGGEDLTAAVLKGAEAKFMAKPDLGRLLPGPDDEGDARAQRIGRLNQLALWTWAERAKLVLFQSKEAEGSAGVLEQALEHEQLKLMPIFSQSAEPVQIRGVDLLPGRDALRKILAEQVELLAGMLRDLAVQSEVLKLDVLLLSGMTSSIPLVRETLQKEFPESDVVSSREPKKCVVRGACHLTAARKAHRYRLNIQGRAATVSRIGSAEYEFLRTDFHEWLAAGQPIPDEGLHKVRVISLSPSGDSI